MVKSENYCVISKLLKILGTEWTAHIILLLAEHDNIRHNQLKSYLSGISSKVITERLRLLEAEGFVERHEERETSNSVSYSLTEAGKALNKSLDNIEQICLNLDINR